MSIDANDWSQSHKLIERARTLYEIERPREALPLLTQALALTPENTQALGWMACCLHELGDNNQALQYAEATIKSDPQNEWGYRLRSIVLRALGKNKKALPAARRALELEPESYYTLLEYSNALADNKKYREALETAEKVRAGYPEKSNAHLQLGYLFFVQKKWTAAEQHLRKALELDPNSYLALNNLGLALIEQSVRRFWQRKTARALSDEGLAYLERAVKLSPNEKLARANVRHSIARIETTNPVVIFLTIPLFICFLWIRIRFNIFGAVSTIFFLAILTTFSLWRKKQYSQSIITIYNHEKKFTATPRFNTSLSSAATSLGIWLGFLFLLSLLVSSAPWWIKIPSALFFLIACLCANKNIRQKIFAKFFQR